jgi:hypothetical protein
MPAVLGERVEVNGRLVCFFGEARGVRRLYECRGGGVLQADLVEDLLCRLRRKLADLIPKSLVWVRAAGFLRGREGRSAAIGLGEVVEWTLRSIESHCHGIR